MTLRSEIAAAAASGDQRLIHRPRRQILPGLELPQAETTLHPRTGQRILIKRNGFFIQTYDISASRKGFILFLFFIDFSFILSCSSPFLPYFPLALSSFLVPSSFLLSLILPPSPHFPLFLLFFSVILGSVNKQNNCGPRSPPPSPQATNALFADFVGRYFRGLTPLLFFFFFSFFSHHLLPLLSVSASASAALLLPPLLLLPLLLLPPPPTTLARPRPRPHPRRRPHPRPLRGSGIGMRKGTGTRQFPRITRTRSSVSTRSQP